MRYPRRKPYDRRPRYSKAAGRWIYDKDDDSPTVILKTFGLIVLFFAIAVIFALINAS